MERAIHPEVRDSGQVAGMFDRIAPAYDRLNHLLSLGRDRGWRRRVARSLDLPAAAEILDLAVGTGDLLLAVLAAHPGVAAAVGVDLSEGMLAGCRAKLAGRPEAERVTLIRADAQNLPLEEGRFEAVTMAFGIRNLADRSRGLREMRRVLRAGGTAVILEFAWPRSVWLRLAYRLWLRTVVPVLGRWFSGDGGAYRYLHQTIEGFDRPAAFCGLLTELGFVDVSVTPLSGGIVGLYRARKPG